MSVIPSGVITVIKKFPEHKRVIQHLAEYKDEFLELCEDYRICKAALEHWNLSDSEGAPLRVNEYRSLLEELEHEILVNINDLK